MTKVDFEKNFTAIDVELANRDYTSICEVGLAKFRGGQLVETWRALLNPESEFEFLYHSNLHGIHQKHISDAPTFPEIYSVLKRFTDQESCIYHATGGFDQVCLSRTCERYSLDDLAQYSEWTSTLNMAMNYWPDEKSYKLEKLCRKIGHDYHPHNALEDAIAAAAIFRAVSDAAHTPAIAAVGGGHDRPRTFRRVTSLRHEKGLHGNPNGPFYKTYIVLSGNFSNPWDDRGTFERYLDELGFIPRGSISGRTQILVTGESPGPSKLEKAHKQNIRIMGEEEFLRYIESEAKT